MLVNDILYSFSIANSNFFALLSEKSNKKLVEKIKEYNFEFNITPPYEYSDTMIIENPFSKEIIYIKCNEGVSNKVTEYKSESLYFNDKTIVFNKKIENESLELNNCILVFSFENDTQKIEFINSKIISPFTATTKSRSEQVLKEKRSFLLLKDYIKKYDIDLFKLLSGDSTYFKKLEETFDFILLESENKLLQNVCNAIFNSFNMNNHRIESKKKSIMSLFLFAKKKMHLEYNRMPMENKQLMTVFTFSMFIMFLSIMINFLGFFT